MKVKTKDLKGRALDYVVALVTLSETHILVFCSNQTGQARWSLYSIKLGYYREIPHYCTWREGDDIIDREKIMTMWCHTGEWKAVMASSEAKPPYFFRQNGANRRTAAMRCYILSKLGEEVEIPDNLLD